MRMIALISLFSLLAGCAGGPGAHGWKAGSTWVLVKVELDLERLADRGSLPLFSPLSEADFGRRPTATGRLGVSNERRVICRVTFHERSANGVYSYPAVNFTGIYADDEDRIESVVKAPPGSIRKGTTSVLHVEALDEGMVRIQGSSGPTLLPYIYIFAPPPARLAPVPLPTVRH